jgi:hypothetical protein
MYDDPSIISPLHVLIPAVIAMVILGAAWNPWNRNTRRAAWGGPVAMAVAFCAVFPWIVGAPPEPIPSSAVGWMFHIAVGMGILGAIDALLFPRIAWYWRVLVFAAAALVGFGLILRLPLVDPDRRNEAALWVAITGGLAVIWWLALREPETDARQTRALAPAALTLMGSAIALTQISSGTVLYTRLSLAVAAAAGSMLVIALLRKDHLASPAASAATVLLLALLLAGRFFAEVTTPVFFGVGAAPLLILILRYATPLPRRRPLAYQLLALAALLLPLAITVAPILLRTLRASDNVSDPYGM